MYYLKSTEKENLKNGLKYYEIAELVGVSKSYICQVFNGKSCSKMLAYCLTKLKDNTKEIDSFFIRRKD